MQKLAWTQNVLLNYYQDQKKIASLLLNCGDKIKPEFCWTNSSASILIKLYLWNFKNSIFKTLKEKKINYLKKETKGERQKGRKTKRNTSAKLVERQARTTTRWWIAEYFENIILLCQSICWISIGKVFVLKDLRKFQKFSLNFNKQTSLISDLIKIVLRLNQIYVIIKQ